MIGLDTSTLVAHELREHNLHQKVRAGIAEQLELKGRFALTLQVLSEFIHVVTDARRFDRPLPMREALTRADFWWNARETVSCHPNADNWAQSRDWLSQYHLGRKRILDTTLAAVTNNTALPASPPTTRRISHSSKCFRLSPGRWRKQKETNGMIKPAPPRLHVDVVWLSNEQLTMYLALAMFHGEFILSIFHTVNRYIIRTPFRFRNSATNIS